jgi:tetratricopeptide (TPR) repeat protein
VLFDLRGRRRRFIQVVYATLAVLLGGGLILFGIGGDVSGGLLDGLGVGSGSGGGDAGFEDQIEEAEQRLQRNPQDSEALIDLVKFHSTTAQQQLEVDEATGQPVGVPPEAAESYQRAADAWDRYLALKPKKPDQGAAALIAQDYFLLAQSSGSASEAIVNLEAAAEAERIVADATPEVGPLTSLASYLYLAGDIAAAEQAKQRALAAAGPQRARVNQQLKLAEQQGEALAKEVERAQQQAQSGGATGGATGGANPLQDPSGALGGGGLGAPVAP